MAGSSKTTTNHDEIRKWAEERGGKPATVKRTESNDEPGVLRIDFPVYRGKDTLEEISWDEFFAKFDEKKLAFLYQEKTAGGEESRFFKLVSRETAEHKSGDTSHKKETAHKAEALLRAAAFCAVGTECVLAREDELAICRSPRDHDRFAGVRVL